MSWEPILMLHALLGEHRADWVVFMYLNWLGVNSRWKSEDCFQTLQRPRRCEDTSISQQVWEMADDQMSWKMDVDQVMDLAVAGSAAWLAVRPCVVTTWVCQPAVSVPSVRTTYGGERAAHFFCQEVWLH